MARLEPNPKRENGCIVYFLDGSRPSETFANVSSFRRKPESREKTEHPITWLRLGSRQLGTVRGGTSV